METILFAGNEYKTDFIYFPGKEAKLIFRDKAFQIYINKNWDNVKRENEIKAVLIKWYEKQAAEEINKSLQHYSILIGTAYNNVRIKDQKTRWGSCSQKRNLNFNWRLIKAPKWILDYVVIHELCHLKHMNHSKEFWSTVEEYCHEYKKAKLWLKENALKLLAD